MNKRKLLVVAVIVFAGGLVAWRQAHFSPHSAAPSPYPSLTVSKPVDPTPAPTANNAIPDWEQRLNRLVNLMGKIPDAELEFEVKDLAYSLPREDILAVLNLQLVPGSENMWVVSNLCMLLFHRWAEAAPSEAAEWLAKVPDNTFSLAASRELASIWAAAKLEEALIWWRSLPEGKGKAAAQFIIAERAAADHQKTALAIELLSGLPPDTERDRMLHFTARKWASTHRDEALAWINRIPDTELRARTLGSVAIDWSVSDPPAAAAFVALMPQGKYQEKAVGNIARFWTVNAPEQAAAWAERFPENPVRGIALQGVAETWARQNIHQAAAWLNKLTTGPSRDAAVSVFVPLLAKSSPDSALHWAETIEDPSLRATARDQVPR